METVKKSNLGLIKTVFNSNTDNVQHYEIINNLFNTNANYLEFSKPIIQTSKGYVLWKANKPGPYFKYSELKDPKQKLYLNQMVQKALRDVSQKLVSFNQDEDFLNKIIEIPSEDAIFYTKNDGKISVVLTEWGFTKDEFVKSQGILKKVFPLGLQSFILKFKSKKGEFLEGINCNVSTYNSTFQGVSDIRGFVSLNDLDKGEDIIVSSTDDSFNEVKITIGENEEYTIIVNREVKLSFNVIDLNNIPVENISFALVSNTLGKEIFTTDNLGKFTLDHIENDDVFKVFDSEEKELLSETIPNIDKEYTLTYNKPLEDIIEQPLEEKIKGEAQVDDILEVKNTKDNEIVIELLNWRKKPIKNHSLSFYGTNKGKENFVTNDKGQFYIDNLGIGKEYSIFMKFKKADWKKDFVHKKENNKYSFIVKNRKILWWWIPFFLLFFFLLSLIPTEVKHHYTVYDNDTNDTLENASINSSVPSVYQTSSLEGMTDNKGKIDVDYGRLPIYKQIFYKPSTTINVTKNDYENLNTKVSLAFFKTNKSDIYLNSIKRDTVVIVEPIVEPAEPIELCDGGGDADSSGGNSIKEFDLKKINSSFIFEYYTGGIHPDIINIYNCSREEISLNNPIWSFNSTTSKDGESAIINYSEKIITIEVIGGGNTESVWEYFVNCP